MRAQSHPAPTPTVEGPKTYCCPGCGKPVCSAKVSKTTWRTFERVDGLAEGLGKFNMSESEGPGDFKYWFAQDVRIGGTYGYHACPTPATGFFALTMNPDPDVPDYEEAGYATKRPKGWGA